MPYTKCQLCGSGVVQALDINICTRCLKHGDDKVKILAIKKYLEKHPEAKFQEVSKALGISREVMDRYIEAGSLMLIDNDGIRINDDNDKKKERDEIREKRKNLARQLSDMENYSKQRFNKEERSQLLIDLQKKRDSGQQR